MPTHAERMYLANERLLAGRTFTVVISPLAVRLDNALNVHIPRRAAARTAAKQAPLARKAHPAGRALGTRALVPFLLALGAGIWFRATALRPDGHA